MATKRGRSLQWKKRNVHIYQSEWNAEQRRYYMCLVTAGWIKRGPHPPTQKDVARWQPRRVAHPNGKRGTCTYKDTAKMSKVSLPVRIEFAACAEPNMPLSQTLSKFPLLQRDFGSRENQVVVIVFCIRALGQCFHSSHIGSDLRLFPLLLDFLPVPWSDHGGFWLQLLPDTTLFEVLGVNRETHVS